MITSTHSIHPNQAKHQPGGAPQWRALLHARGLSDAAIERAGLRPDRQGWTYPIAPGGPARRWKAFPGQGGAKYRWLPTRPADARFYDPCGDLAAHIAAADGALILAEGEPDVWACWSAGVFHATATMHGAGTIPAWLVDELRRLGVTRVLVWPDRDSAGLTGAAKLRAVLAGSGIVFEAHELPAALGDKGDMGALLLRVGADRLVAALEACPPLDLPDLPPEPAPRPTLPVRSVPEDAAGLYEQWCIEVEAAAVAAWQIAPPNQKGQSRRNFSSPFRDDKRPSAQWNYTAHGFKDYATGEFSNTKRVAELLGLPSWADYYKAQRPAPAGSAQAAAPVDDDALHYPHGFPYTLTRTLLTSKDVMVDNEDLAGLLIVELAHTLCRMPAQVTISEYARLARDGGWPVDRRLVARWLAWGAEQGLYKNLPIAEVPKSNRLKTVQGRYEFKPLRERLHALGAYLEPRRAAPRRAPASAGEIAAVLGQPAEGLDALDAARADALDAAAVERDQYAAGAARWLATWNANIERILAGDSAPLELDPQPLSAPRLRTTLAQRLIAEGVEVRDIVRRTGISRPKALELARAAGFESVPQTVTVPADEVSERVRARGLVLHEQDGQATIRRPNVLKPIDKLTEAEKRAAGEQRAVQRGLAHRRLARPQNALEARWRRQDARHQQADAKAAAQLAGLHALPHRRPRRDRLDAWLDHQWELAPPLAPPPIDPDTGEVFKGRTRWLAAFEVARGDTMSFTVFSEPKEREHEQEAPNTNTEALQPTVQGAPADRGAADRRGDRRGAGPLGDGRVDRRPDVQPAAGADARRPARDDRPAEAGVRGTRARFWMKDDGAPPNVATIDGMPYTAAMLERRARRLAGQGDR